MLSARTFASFTAGRHRRIHDFLGAHPGAEGTDFAVWAPNARSVSVVGDFNDWRTSADRMELEEVSGVWTVRVARAEVGSRYKYRVTAADGSVTDRSDPVGACHEQYPSFASVVWSDRHEWGDAGWMASRGERQRADAPMSIYEVHLGSWLRRSGDAPTYRSIATLLADHVVDHGFTHVELLPLMEHPFTGSWGYEVTGYFAPTSRYGTPDDLRYLVDHLHQRGIGVIFDWVPAHFPDDPHGLVRFDGTPLYEYGDPRLGRHADWNTLVFDYRRNEVRSFLISSAIAWVERFHADGIRVDAVASMLYRNYSRPDGQWVPNEHGGAENLEAVTFLRELNDAISCDHPDVATFAEESTAWPLVTHPTSHGGLGFRFTWDLGWMHDTLAYLGHDPIHRSHHHRDLTFRSTYANAERFVLPLSHDEVTQGKRSLISRFPGDAWQQRATLRLLLGYQWTSPGIPLLFMGGEFGQWREWNHDSELDWYLLDTPEHAGIARWVGDLNAFLRAAPAIHRSDAGPDGFRWIDADDTSHSVIAFERFDGDTPVVVVANFTPVVWRDHRIGVDVDGQWVERLNSDAPIYGGSGQGNLGAASATPVPAHGRSCSLNLTLPPLGLLVLTPASPGEGHLPSSFPRSSPPSSPPS